MQEISYSLFISHSCFGYTMYFYTHVLFLCSLENFLQVSSSNICVLYDVGKFILTFVIYFIFKNVENLIKLYQLSQYIVRISSDSPIIFWREPLENIGSWNTWKFSFRHHDKNHKAEVTELQVHV